MYRNFLFRYGVQSFLPYKRGSPVHGRGYKCGSGIHSNSDNHLLSLVRGVARMSVTPKLTTQKSSGSGLKFVR